MNWNDIKAKATPYLSKVNPLLEKVSPYLKKAEEFGGKTIDFAQKQLQNTPIVLKSEEELTLLKEQKRLIVISYEDGSKEGQEILLRSPIWSTIVWTEAATLRFLSSTTSPELARTLDFPNPVCMKVYWLGEIKHTFTDIDSIKKWWNDRNYDGSENTGIKNPVQEEKKSEPKNEEKQPDPLSKV